MGGPWMENRFTDRKPKPRAEYISPPEASTEMRATVGASGEPAFGEVGTFGPEPHCRIGKVKLKPAAPNKAAALREARRQERSRRMIEIWAKKRAAAKG